MQQYFDQGSKKAKFFAVYFCSTKSLSNLVKYSEL